MRICCKYVIVVVDTYYAYYVIIGIFVLGSLIKTNS